MSNDFAWDLTRLETARDNTAVEVYDVQLEKQLIVQFPRPVELIDLEHYNQLFRDSLEGILLKPLNQWCNVDTGFPVIFGREPGGRRFLLDGWHRMAKALESSLKQLPAVTLTEEETAAVKTVHSN